MIKLSFKYMFDKVLKVSVFVCIFLLIIIDTTFAGNPYSSGQCTWWVYERITVLYGFCPVISGNAGGWYDNCLAVGLTRGSTPKKGAIACWNNGFGNDTGHVAVVEQVYSDHIHISEYNWDIAGEYDESDVYFSNINRSSDNKPNRYLKGYIYIDGDINPEVPAYLTNPIVYNDEWYKTYNSQVQNMTAEERLQHWINTGSVLGWQASPAFFAIEYRDMYDDLKNAFGTSDYREVIKHFVTFGISEGRNGRGIFHFDYYKANYKDLQDAFGNDNYKYYEHFVTNGYAEGREAGHRLQMIFNGNGGTPASQQKDMTMGTTIGTVPTATRDNYIFKEWNTKKDGTGNTVTSSYKPTGHKDITVYAQWTPVYKLDVNGKLDGVEISNVKDIATFDIKVGSTQSNDVYDYCNEKVPKNTSYTVNDIKAASGKKYIGNATVSGTVTAATKVILEFHSLYNITYNKNTTDTVSSIPDKQTKEWGVDLTLSDKNPERSGYVFLYWNTKADGTGVSYYAKDTYKGNAAQTLYAIWGYTITFQANGGENAPEPMTERVGNNITLPTEIPTWNDYKFYGWRAVVDGEKIDFQPGEVYDLQITKGLWAIWGNDVVFDANGGSNAPEGFVKYLNYVSTLPIEEPVREGYRFLGWSGNKEAKEAEFPAGSEFDNNQITTLYAVWENTEPDFVLPASLTVIEEEAFEGGSFTFVVVPASVTEIGARAFAHCENLRHIRFLGKKTIIDDTAFEGVENLTFHVPGSGTAYTYARAYGYEYIVEDTTN